MEKGERGEGGKYFKLSAIKGGEQRRGFVCPSFKECKEKSATKGRK
jgi:hypothetical protein